MILITSTFRSNYRIQHLQNLEVLVIREGIVAVLAVAAHLHDAPIFQDAQMVARYRLLDAQPLVNLGYVHRFLLVQHFDNEQAMRMCNRSEHLRGGF